MCVCAYTIICLYFLQSEHEDLEVLGQDSVVGAVSDDSAMAVAQPVDVSPDQDQDPQL